MSCKSYVNAILNSLCTYLYVNFWNTKETEISGLKPNLVKIYTLLYEILQEGTIYVEQTRKKF